MCKPQILWNKVKVETFIGNYKYYPCNYKLFDFVKLASDHKMDPHAASGGLVS